MALKFAPIVLGLLQLATGLPTHSANTLEDLLMVDDTVSVGSYVRETRAAAPDDWHKSIHRDGDGEIGYSRKKTGGGKKGYQHFDTYHKKAGDNYEFEKQDSYGQDEKGQDGAYSDNHETRADRERDPEEFEDEDEEHPRQKQKLRKEKTYSEFDDGEEDRPRRKQKQHKEDTHSELREGLDDGNGGVEAHGHDPSDYTLPEKYTWGESDAE